MSTYHATRRHPLASVLLLTGELTLDESLDPLDLLAMLETDDKRDRTEILIVSVWDFET